MKKILRLLLSVAVIGIAARAVYSFVILRMSCDIAVRVVQMRTLPLLDDSNQLRVAPFARRNVERLRRCLTDCATVNAYMLSAANLTLLGAREEAAEMYMRALQLDRRPELYLNLGTLQLEMGNRAAAIENLVRARVFNQFVESEVPASVREEVRLRATAILPDQR